MKSIAVIFAVVLFTGCYTQVRTSGDYWGYTGHRERDKVYATPDTTPQEMVQDSNYYSDSGQGGDLRMRNDEGYSNGDYGDRGPIYDDPYYYNYAPYYSSPWISFNVGYGWGWHRPWLGLGFGYASYYPYWYPNYYWDWGYSPLFSPYSCLAFGYYPYYRPYYGGWGGWGYRNYYGSLYPHYGLGSGRLGRINGGEGRVGRSSIISTNGGNFSGRSSISSLNSRSTAPNRAQNPAYAQNPAARQNMNAPRNNPRLLPQSSSRSPRQGAYSSAPRNYGNMPRYGGGGYRNYSGGGMTRSYGGGSRGGGGGGSRSSGGGHRGR